MKKTKGILLLFITIFSLGGFGCMKSNNDISIEETKLNMLQYAEEKYDESFEMVDFKYAVRGLDSNYHDILVLKNDGSIIFNIYSNTNTNDCFDDYGMSVADKKISDYIKESSPFELTLMVDLLAEEQIFPNDINSLSAPQIINNYKVAKVIVVVKVDNIEDNINGLYQLYQTINSLNSNLIDFEVVASNGADEKLDRVFDNIRLEYENDWSQYPSISKCLSISDKRLTKERFELLIEEV